MNDKKLDDRKEEYKNMKIPSELKSKVLESMEQAKKEKESQEKTEVSGKKNALNKQNIKSNVSVKRMAQIAAGLLLAITIAANANASIANAMEKIPLIGAIVRVVTFRNYEVRNENTQVDIKIPIVEDVTDYVVRSDATKQINKSVEEYTNQIITEFEADIAEFAEYEGEDGGPHEAVYTDYEVITDTDNLFSLRINTTISKGGSVNRAMIYHIDKRTDSVFSFKDLFVEGTDYISIISDNIKEQMRSKIASGGGESYFIDSEDGFDEFDFKEIAETQNFYLNQKEKLMVVFDEYEVAPGYMGIVEFEIPTSVLQGMVKDGYVK